MRSKLRAFLGSACWVMVFGIIALGVHYAFTQNVHIMVFLHGFWFLSTKVAIGLALGVMTCTYLDRQEARQEHVKQQFGIWGLVFILIGVCIVAFGLFELSARLTSLWFYVTDAPGYDPNLPVLGFMGTVAANTGSTLAIGLTLIALPRLLSLRKRGKPEDAF